MDFQIGGKKLFFKRLNLEFKKNTIAKYQFKWLVYKELQNM
jgi:hypothetical protein